VITALKPIENRRVRGASSERYPLNEISSHPESTEAAEEAHHIFPRSQIKSDSWFVEIEESIETKMVIPHVTGLTREQHEVVERHDAWIKLEDGVFNWYDRVPADEGPGAINPAEDVYECPPGWFVSEGDWWHLIGPLNPQPGAQGKAKKKVKRLTGEARRNRITVSIKIPQDYQENGGAIWDEKLDDLRVLAIALEAPGVTEDSSIWPLIMAALNEAQESWTAQVKEILKSRRKK
jgi:hypothetical protein